MSLQSQDWSTFAGFAFFSCSVSNATAPMQFVFGFVWAVLEEINIPPRKELHRSLWVGLILQSRLTLSGTREDLAVVVLRCQ